MAEIIVNKRVRSQMVPKCGNCGSTKLHLLRQNAHYEARKCHECGEYLCAGNTEMFIKHQTEINQARIAREEGRS